MEKLKPDFIDQVRRLFEKSFYWACVAVLEAQWPDTWLSLSVHKPLCDAMQDFTHNTRLGVILPRDWLKSTLGSIYYPVWRAMPDTNFTSLCTLNTYTNGTKKLIAKRSLIRGNPFLKQIFPERMPDSSCQQSAEAFSLPRKTPLADATFEAAGVGTDVTSRHFDLLVEDDTVAPEFDRMTGDVYEPSSEQCEKAIGLHKSGHFLLNDFLKSQRIVIGTRWRQNDLFAHIIKNEPQYKIINRASKENSQGKPDEDGHIVYPERFPQEALDETRNSVGDYMYNALMMNSPLSASDMIFRDADILNYEDPPRDVLTFTSVDPAPVDSKASSDPDYNVVLTTAVPLSGGGVYVLDYFRERCTPSDVIDAVFRHVDLYHPIRVGVEGVNYQNTLGWWIKETQNKRRIWFNVEEFTTSRIKKTARIRGLEPIVKNHQLFLRSWMKELRQELVAFDRGAHDDLADALAYQVPWWRHIEVLEEDRGHIGFDRFTGGHILEELRGRSGRPKGFPFDVMGVTEDGRDLVTVVEDRELETNFCFSPDKWSY